MTAACAHSHDLIRIRLNFIQNLSETGTRRAQKWSTRRGAIAWKRRRRPARSEWRSRIIEPLDESVINAKFTFYLALGVCEPAGKNLLNAREIGCHCRHTFLMTAKRKIKTFPSRGIIFVKIMHVSKICIAWKIEEREINERSSRFVSL
jgi:hypothetical protein